jgi:hypothetical protein
MGTFPLLPEIWTPDDNAQRSLDACMLGLSWFSGKPSGLAFGLHPLPHSGYPKFNHFRGAQDIGYFVEL